jgi:hypothetical protein
MPLIRVLKRLAKLVEASKVPRPSLILESGRGIWVLWFLHSEDEASKVPKADPVHHWPNYNKWKALERELAHRLRMFKVVRFNASERRHPVRAKV